VFALLKGGALTIINWMLKGITTRDFQGDKRNASGCTIIILCSKISRSSFPTSPNKRKADF
jgi:hypothetical protein